MGVEGAQRKKAAGAAMKKGPPAGGPWQRSRADQLLIRRLAVRGDVQTLALLVFRHAQADHQVDDLVGDQRDHARPDDGQQHALELDPHLGDPMPLEPTAG